MNDTALVTKSNVADIYNEATKSAAFHTIEYIQKHGEHPFNCGFAWVTIKPARGPMVAYLKSIGKGSRAHDGGFQVWNPSGHPTQDMSAKYEGACAFAAILQKHGIRAYAGSRLD